MRLAPVCLAASFLALASPLPALAMGSGPHPHVLYGIPYSPAHGAYIPPVPAASTEPSTTARTLADHPLYTLVGAIAIGELLLWLLMLIGSARKPDHELEE
jgi:hypothetical protein